MEDAVKRTMHLDPKALEAAVTASTNAMIRNEPDVEAAIRAYLSAAVPADATELVERLEEEGFLRAREKQELHGGDERWLNDRIQKDMCSRAASLIQSQAARERELMDALEHVTELLVDTWHVVMPLDNDPKQEIAVLRARALLNRRAEG